MLPADVLLARLQGQDVTPTSLAVHRCPDEPAWNSPDQRIAAGHEADVGPSERKRDAERLAVAHCDVRPVIAGRPEHAHGDGIDTGDEQGPGLVGDLRGVVRRLQDAVEVRLLEDHGRRRRGHCFPEAVDVHPAVRGRLHTEDLIPLAVGIGAQDLSIFWVQRAGDHDVLAPGVNRRHRRRLCEGGGSVVHGGVGDVEAAQQGNHRLVLVDRLQPPLAGFRLIGRVRAVEVGPGDGGVDDRGAEAARGTTAQEVQRRRNDLVELPQLAEILDQLDLGEGFWKVERPQLQVVRDLAEDGRPDARAPGPGAFRLLLCRVRQVGHQFASSRTRPIDGAVQPLGVARL